MHRRGVLGEEGRDDMIPQLPRYDALHAVVFELALEGQIHQLVPFVHVGVCPNRLGDDRHIEHRGVVMEVAIGTDKVQRVSYMTPLLRP